ncbi:hypothetical protein DNK34_14045 [Pseudomonas dryadis]|uniref:Uncharacterized protein n=1 Tax=Phytopseudomonas dryadis TaxID=2487520 RepID=A0A4Q9R1S3_9GAMM|nr:hypothetical protein DNK44_11140 [Pseudomonas dryadis]TBV04666.1 hypothetical protein DNK34_14045 [Pseudomonas dryadis]TBV17246.1 hypothetical protein DNK41_13035 [Pseudomonas sp. FRB 230]
MRGFEGGGPTRTRTVEQRIMGCRCQEQIYFLHGSSVIVSLPCLSKALHGSAFGKRRTAPELLPCLGT